MRENLVVLYFVNNKVNKFDYFSFPTALKKFFPEIGEVDKMGRVNEL